MFLGRYNKFQCDKCLTKQFAEKWPEDWIYGGGKFSQPVTHFCPKCQTEEMRVEFKKRIDKRNEKLKETKSPIKSLI